MATNVPAQFFAFMFIVTAAFYVPGRINFGAGSWFEFGPFSVQHGRVLLYTIYFFFGAGIGSAVFDRGLLAADGQLAQRSWNWAVAGAHSLLRDVGADLHQARNPGKSAGAAGLV